MHHRHHDRALNMDRQPSERVYKKLSLNCTHTSSRAKKNDTLNARGLRALTNLRASKTRTGPGRLSIAARVCTASAGAQSNVNYAVQCTTVNDNRDIHAGALKYKKNVVQPDRTGLDGFAFSVAHVQSLKKYVFAGWR